MYVIFFFLFFCSFFFSFYYLQNSSPSILEVNSKGPESKIHEIYKKATNYPTIAYLTPSYASSSSLVSNFIHYLAERQTVFIIYIYFIKY